MRPLDVSTAMFAIAAQTVNGEPCPPELVKILFEYVEKLEAAEQALQPTMDWFWLCQNCEQKNGKEYDVCWRCGHPRR